jgi:hypothetical protein
MYALIFLLTFLGISALYIKWLMHEMIVETDGDHASKVYAMLVGRLRQVPRPAYNQVC